MTKNILYRFAFSKIIVIVLFAILFSGITLSLGNDAFAFVKASETITLSMSETDSLYSLSTTLQDIGVIDNAFSFWCYVKYKNAETSLENFHGSIELNSSMSYREILREFKNFQIQ